MPRAFAKSRRCFLYDAIGLKSLQKINNIQRLFEGPMRSNIVRYYRNCGRISIRCWIHKRHPIPRPDGRVMGCLLWMCWENWPRYNGTALYYVEASTSSADTTQWDVRASLGTVMIELGWKVVLIYSFISNPQYTGEKIYIHIDIYMCVKHKMNIRDLIKICI